MKSYGGVHGGKRNKWFNFGVIWITMLTLQIANLGDELPYRKSVLSECSCLFIFIGIIFLLFHWMIARSQIILYLMIRDSPDWINSFPMISCFISFMGECMWLLYTGWMQVTAVHWVNAGDCCTLGECRWLLYTGWMQVIAVHWVNACDCCTLGECRWLLYTGWMQVTAVHWVNAGDCCTLGECMWLLYTGWMRVQVTAVHWVNCCWGDCCTLGECGWLLYTGWM